MGQLVYSPKSLGNVIRRVRKAKKLSQSQTGSPFKLEQSTLSHIEQGVPGTRIETVFRVLAALDLEIVIRSKKENDSKTPGTW